MKQIKFLRIRFQPTIQAAELPKFRGAVIQAVEQSHILFHNHQGDAFRYAYPLIQYQRERGYPVIVCIEEGVDEIHALFERRIDRLRLGARAIDLKVDAIDLKEWRLEVSPRFFQQHIRHWLALSSDNYTRYQRLSDELERRAFLANILRGNLLAMAKGLGWYIEQEVLVAMHEISSPRPVFYKDTRLMAFDATFSANILLPPGIGLGKGAAKGFGVVRSVLPKPSGYKQ